MRRDLVIGIVVALLVGLVGGYFVGRWRLDAEWRQPRTQLTPDAAKRSAEGDANPAPAAGTWVLKAMPLERTRLAVKELVAEDPFVMTVGAVGRDDDEVGIHLTLENRGDCKIIGYSGVVYGFDAWGRPSRMNRKGEHYVAIAGELEEPLEPGGKHRHEQVVQHVDDASLAVAHIDRVKCEGGGTWQRAL